MVDLYRQFVDILWKSTLGKTVLNTCSILGSMLCAAMIFAGSAHAATITVDGADGAVLMDGTCSISEAILAANSDTAVNECSAGSGADTIILSTSITLTETIDENATYGSTGTPEISSHLIIDGAGFSIERQSILTCNYDFSNDAGEFRLLRTSPSADLTLKNLVLSHGCADGGITDGNGAAIHNQGSLSIGATSVSFNTAVARGGGIYSVGTIGTIENSTLLTNSAGYMGGGIYSSGVISAIRNNTISDNYADDLGGGGILNDGTIVMIENNLFSSNSAPLGGGLLNFGMTIATLQNNTFSGNSAQAGGGLANDAFIDTMQNNTFSGNSATSSGKAIQNSGAIETIRNSLFHNNLTSGGALECENSGIGAITGSNDNMSDDASSNCPGVSTLLTSSTVATLSDNGGPTKTHALLASSEAIDASGVGATATDQRGFAVVNARDIGAFEYLGIESDLIFENDFEGNETFH